MTDRRRARDEQPPRRAPRSADSASTSSASTNSASTNGASSAPAPDPERDRRVRRARFLADLAEARELRKRVAPRRARAAELEARVLRTFRY
jgi:hypothetical protein